MSQSDRATELTLKFNDFLAENVENVHELVLLQRWSGYAFDNHRSILERAAMEELASKLLDAGFGEHDPGAVAKALAFLQKV